MKEVMEFVLAALPWIIGGVALATFIVLYGKKQEKVNQAGQSGNQEAVDKAVVKKEKFTGVCMGIGFGLVIGFCFTNAIGLPAGIPMGVCTAVALSIAFAGKAKNQK